MLTVTLHAVRQFDMCTLSQHCSCKAFNSDERASCLMMGHMACTLLTFPSCQPLPVGVTTAPISSYTTRASAQSLTPRQLKGEACFVSAKQAWLPVHSQHCHGTRCTLCNASVALAQPAGTVSCSSWAPAASLTTDGCGADSQRAGMWLARAAA